MPRVHERKAGSRNYLTGYSEDTLSRALDEINSGKVSIRKASREYKIPFGTLRHKVKGLHQKSHGGQKRLSDDCERLLLSALDSLADWKVPLGELDIRCLVKSYLDERGITDSRFQNNLPGPDWLKNFVRRHNLTQRLADNVKGSRAEITQELVNGYFDNLETSVEGVTPENIYNYDETNVTDNPKAKTVIVRRGRRRVERKIEHSKQTISLMFCGSATGQYLPPMVVYRAANLYSSWTQNGPRGAIYDSTPSGWFDSRTFEFWFENLFLPNVSSNPGPKVIIGDNLPSHFSPNVIQAAGDHNIRFITMPPNATHLCQPLDVAVFQPVKRTWRKLLEQWRKESRRKGSIPKSVFPSLLKKLWDTLAPQNLISGFRASGICPINRQEVLKRLPDAGQDPGGAGTNQALNDSVMEMLRSHCGLNQTTERRAPRRRGKKVVPGRAITPEDVQTDHSTSSRPTTSAIASAEEKWVCHDCKQLWEEEGDDRWIVCDKCNKQYHLQCSGITYHRRDYYVLDIEDMTFHCVECSPSSD